MADLTLSSAIHTSCNGWKVAVQLVTASYFSLQLRTVAAVALNAAQNRGLYDKQPDMRRVSCSGVFPKCRLNSMWYASQ